MTETLMKIIKCRQEGCTASSDGKCLEGLKLEACPHCSIIESENQVEKIILEVEDTKIENEDDLFYEVHLGEALELNETNNVTNSSLTRLIILAGLSGTGKTTMLASLFDLFQKNNSYNQYDFAGSKTLIGFEKRCHDSRTRSGRNKADTERTKLLPPVFLHLKVKKGTNSTDLLFTDISGELFKNLTDSSQECERFELAKRADHFVLFIDSDQLSELEQRHIVKNRSTGILRSLEQAKMIDPEAFIEVVFSRWDMLCEKNDISSHEEFVNGVQQEIINKFSKRYKNIAFFKIACRPNNNGFDFGYGIDNLFNTWVEESPFLHGNSYIESNRHSLLSSREFSKYTNM